MIWNANWCDRAAFYQSCVARKTLQYMRLGKNQCCAAESLSKNSNSLVATFNAPCAEGWTPSDSKSLRSQISPSLRGVKPSAHR